MSASLAQDRPASPSGASTLATSDMGKDFFTGPTWSVAEPVLSPTVKLARSPCSW